MYFRPNYGYGYKLWEHAYFSTLCRGQLQMDGAFSNHPINAEFHVFYHELYNP